MAGNRRLNEAHLRIAPSLLAADFGELRDQVAMIEAAGAEVLHLDVMDGHFVPNISFGIPVIERLRRTSKLFFDTHLMIDDPLGYAEPFIKSGSDNLTFHVEIRHDPRRVIEQIRSHGASAGVALNPGTPAEAIAPVISEVDLVLVMSVWPGFGGQRFIDSSLEKMTAIRRQLRSDQRLEVDGGISTQTIGLAARAGADMFVAGTSIFGESDPVTAMDELRRLAAGDLL